MYVIKNNNSDITSITRIFIQGETFDLKLVLILDFNCNGKIQVCVCGGGDNTHTTQLCKCMHLCVLIQSPEQDIEVSSSITFHLTALRQGLSLNQKFAFSAKLVS